MHLHRTGATIDAADWNRQYQIQWQEGRSPAGGTPDAPETAVAADEAGAGLGRPEMGVAFVL